VLTELGPLSWSIRGVDGAVCSPVPSSRACLCANAVSMAAYCSSSAALAVPGGTSETGKSYSSVLSVNTKRGCCCQLAVEWARELTSTSIREYRFSSSLERSDDSRLTMSSSNVPSVTRMSIRVGRVWPIR
jgi:hypothetical protein